MKVIVILLIINIAIMIIGFIIVVRKTKIRRNKWIEAMIGRISLENINVTDCFSKEVLNFYLDVLKDTNKYEITEHTLRRIDSKISIWVANTESHRRWYTSDSDSKDKVDELNKTLTVYDKVLLDRIVTSIKERHDKLVTKFFL